MAAGGQGDAPEAGPAETDGEAGFVLLSVLLATVLFLAAAASFAIDARLLAMQEANRLEAARAQALADGAAVFAIHALQALPAAPGAPADPSAAVVAATPAPAATPDAGGLAVDGTPLVCDLPGGRRLALFAVDQGGLLDLNAAPRDMIVDVLRAGGIDAGAATRIAGEIVDYRDPDDVPDSGGASEAAAYRAAGLAFAPRNGPFLDAAEIAQLPAVTAALRERLETLSTVFNERAGIDLAATDRRAKARFSRDAAIALARWALPSPRRSFAVEARLWRADGGVAARRRALVRLPGEGGGTLRVLQWQADPMPALGAAPDRVGDDEPCPALAAALAAAG